MPEIATERKLIEVAIDLFGRKGPDAVTTRIIAEAAGAQQSAISYHFGSKDRLYLACAEHIAATMRERIAQLLVKPLTDISIDDAKSRIALIVGGMSAIMMQDEIAPIARFIVREQMNPTPAFAVLYDGAMRHIVEPMVVLLGTISGDSLTIEELRVRCIALMGQVFALRSARAALMCITGWEHVGPRETGLVRDVVVANTRAVLADLEWARMTAASP
jgi:AcrR family transcriptional regulator